MLLAIKSWALTALLVTGVARAQSTDAETWARELVDSPHYASGDEHALALSWLALLEREPSHALAEVTLRMLGELPRTDSQELAERVWKLDGAFLPLARAELDALRSEWRPATELRITLDAAKRAELYPGCLRSGVALGPLAGACDDPLRDALFADPGFDREHVGTRGLAVRWSPLVRASDDAYFAAESVVSPALGWAATAFTFDAREGGAGWVELDCSGGPGPRWLTVLAPQDRDWRGVLRDPSFSFSFNGAPAHEVDFLVAERSFVERAPVRVRAGHNRLVIASNLNARLRFSVRVLTSDGRPWPALVEVAPRAQLGADSASELPAAAPQSSERFLRALATRGPDCEALLGVIELHDGRPSEGLTRIARAVESAPDRAGLQVLLSQAYANAPQLPDSWKRGRSRELAERAAQAAPEHAANELALARTFANEDREEEALAKLTALASRAPAMSDAKLELAATYSRLDLAVPAERAMFDALALPRAQADVLEAAAGHFEQHGLPSRALELRARQARLADSSDALLELAGAQAALGHVAAAEASYRAAIELDGTWNTRSELAEHLIRCERFAEADELLAGIVRDMPCESWFVLRRADVARLRGDASAELEHLRAVARLQPSHPSARTRLFALTKSEPARDFEARYALDVDATLASFDPTKWNDSVVRVIDAALVYVFEDGAFEQLNHERKLVRDLEGCESEGKQHPSGEVLSIATIKASDGRAYEPVAVNGEYVMPSLEPGDTVELIQRASHGAPTDDVVRTGLWSFASVGEPFHLSRYVISIPKALGVRMVLRNFAGEHREIDEGERVVHVFEVREHPRVLLQPSAPPPEWLLPSVQFGHDRERADVARLIAETTTLATRASPEIAAAAAGATQGIAGDEARARALHAFVVQALDKRAPASRASAVAALVTREGNGAWLYSALLDAADVPHEIVWSRAVAPAGDSEPDPAFVDPGRWMRQALVLVKPRDGQPAWCDMGSRTLPYGTRLTGAPGAIAFAVGSREWLELPDVPLRERDGQRQTARLVLDGERGADVEATVAFSGNLGFLLKEQFREVPQAQRKRSVQRNVGAMLPGIDVESFDLPGIDGESEPLTFVVKGKIKSLIDESGDETACKLPFPPLVLSNLAAGEGERTQPFFLGRSIVSAVSVRMELPEGWRLAREFTGLALDFRGGSYLLSLEPDGDRAFTLRRELYLPPMVLEAAAYPELVAFAKRVDEAERARLVFAKP